MQAVLVSPQAYFSLRNSNVTTEMASSILLQVSLLALQKWRAQSACTSPVISLACLLTSLRPCQRCPEHQDKSCAAC